MSCVCCSESERALDSRDIIINLLMTVPLNRLIMTSLLRIIYVLYCYSRVVIPFCKLLKITRFTNNVTEEDIGQ